MIKNKKVRLGLQAAFVLLLALIAVVGICDFLIPTNISEFAGSETPDYFLISVQKSENSETGIFSDAGADVEKNDARAVFCGILPIKNVSLNEYKNIRLYPGGMPFGVKFFTRGVIIVGFSEIETEDGKFKPASEAGLKSRDVIIKVNGKDVSGVGDVTGPIADSGGKPVEFTVERSGKEMTISVTPLLSKDTGDYRIGIWVRNSGAGIGTITFIEPDTLAFGGLGHGICDSDTGELMPFLRGTVSGVTINGIKKGLSGNPGELCGIFSSDKTGSLISNTECGVFGVFTELPLQSGAQAIPIGLKNELKEGKAQIYTTLDDNAVTAYDVEIKNINRNSTGSKCFVVHVTDPRLLERTGGIVQGMSGSPIIQNGKLVGAVTHVLINDPSTGYGIFIENMLANMPSVLQ